MDRLKAMQTFVRIVQANSFSKAAETMNLPRASLTTTLQNLEAYLGTRLLQRTTRRISMTPEGEDYFQKCLDILGQIDEAEEAFRAQTTRIPSGRLRVDLPGAVGRHVVVPSLSRFMDLYPQIELVVSLSDRLVDLTREGIDCALRVGALQDSSLVGRQIGSMQFVNCASPAYLQRHGVPLRMEDLERHQAVVHFSGRTGRAFDWDFLDEGKAVTVRTKGAISVDDADAYVLCGLQGMGLIQAARYQVGSHLASGALVEVLTEFRPVPMPVSLLYPHGRASALKVGAFIGWLAGIFGEHPDFQDGSG